MRNDPCGGHLITLSGPNVVRIEIMLTGQSTAWLEAAADEAIHSGWCVLDSARKAFEKAGCPVPVELTSALAALGKWSS